MGMGPPDLARYRRTFNFRGRAAYAEVRGWYHFLHGVNVVIGSLEAGR